MGFGAWSRRPERVFGQEKKTTENQIVAYENFRVGGRSGYVWGGFGCGLARFPLRFTRTALGFAKNSLRRWSGTGLREPGLGGGNAFLDDENPPEIEFLHANLFGSKRDRGVIGVGLDAFWPDFRFDSRARRRKLRRIPRGDCQGRDVGNLL